MEIFPHVLSYLRKLDQVEDKSSWKLYVYQTSDTPCSDFEVFCNRLGTAVLAPNKKVGVFLLFLQQAIQCPFLLDDSECEYYHESPEPQTIDEIVDWFLRCVGADAADYLKFKPERFITGEKISIIRDTSRVLFFKGDEDKPYDGYQRAILYQTPKDIADAIEGPASKQKYRLKVPLKYLKL